MKSVNAIFAGIAALPILVLVVIPTVFACSSYEYQCDNGYCLNRQYFCDGYRYHNGYTSRGCSDNSDEEHCECFNGPSCYIKPKPLCKAKEFRCASGNCIPETWECDGDYDCADLSDEHANCKEPCDDYQFSCDNGVCIDAQLKCNANNDCGDNSDETVCQIYPSQGHINPLTDCEDAFRCKDGTCVPFNALCNGVKDCRDGSDEGSTCPLNCTDKCEHNAVKTPSGCQCICPQGYRLAGDGLTCIDMLECIKDPPPCSQLCSESVGSYSCKCFREFTMRYDNITCKSNGSKMSIYFAVHNEIRQYIPARRNLKVIGRDPEEKLNALELDVASGALYYSSKGNSSLHQIIASNGTQKSIANVGEAKHIALDWITKNIYVVTKKTLLKLRLNELLPTEEPKADDHLQDEETKINQIQVCNVPVRRCANIAETTHQITVLEIDPLNRFLIYATSLRSTTTSQETASLIRTGLDGKFHATIANFNETINNIAIDYRQKFVYIAGMKSIVRFDYDGGRSLNIVETSMVIKDMSIFEDQLYFLTEEGLTMHKCCLYGDTRRCTSFRLSAETTEMFVIDQETRQTPGRNACANYNCSHLCVPTKNGATCICENGKAVDEQSDCRE